MTEYDVSAAFEQIENELIDSMMRNFQRHRAEETEEGFLWSQWQAEQLAALEEYRRRNEKRFKPRFRSLNEKIEEMIAAARADGSSDAEAGILEAIRSGAPISRPQSGAGAFFRINDRKLDALIKATHSDLERAETAVLRMSRDKYRSAIFNAQVYANMGAGTYEKAVDMAVRDMLRAGLNCVEYSNGARHTLADYAQMAIRTANKRAYLMGEGEKRSQWGITTVVVNSRRGGCRECAQYIGKVFIDDVYSGGTKADGDYPLLSEAIRNGLFHPNCKDSTSTYYEGITTLKPVTEEELREMDRREAVEQRESYHRNQAKRNRRLADHSLDPDNRRKYAARAKINEEKAEKYREKLSEKIGEKLGETGNSSPILSEYKINSTPGEGNIEYDENYDQTRHRVEIDFAEWLKSYYGGDIRLLNEANENRVKTPDYLWNGKCWELKTVTKEKSADNAVRSALKQIAVNPGGIFLDYGENEVSIEQVIEVINKRIVRYKAISLDVIIVRKGNVVAILRYKK